MHDRNKEITRIALEQFIESQLEAMKEISALIKTATNPATKAALDVACAHIEQQVSGGQDARNSLGA